MPLTADHLLARLSKISPEDVRRDIHVNGEVQPLSAWSRDALALLARIEQLGKLGDHILHIKQNLSPNRTLPYIADTFVLETITAMQCTLMNELRPLIPVVEGSSEDPAFHTVEDDIL